MPCTRYLALAFKQCYWLAGPSMTDNFCLRTLVCDFWQFLAYLHTLVVYHKQRSRGSPLWHRSDCVVPYLGRKKVRHFIIYRIIIWSFANMVKAEHCDLDRLSANKREIAAKSLFMSSVYKCTINSDNRMYWKLRWWKPRGCSNYLP